MPPPTSRRHRPSFPTSSIDDINHLTLPEIRDRLERNERVLKTTIFSSPPPPSILTNSNGPTPSPVSPNMSSPRQGSIPIPMTMPIAGPSTFTGSIPLQQPGQLASSPVSTATLLGTSPTDPVRDKLLQARAQLLAREQELLMNGLNIKDDVGSGTIGEARRASGDMLGNSQGNGLLQPQPRRGAEMSGKRRAMQSITAAEATFAPNGLILPMAQSLALANRDFEASTADNFGAMTLTASSSPKPRRTRLDAYPDLPGASPSSSSRLRGNAKARAPQNGLDHDNNPHETDEIARATQLARLNAFMRYKGDPDLDGDDYDDDEGSDGEVDQMFDFDPQDGQYAGEDDRLEIPAPGRGLRELGTGEAVDEFGEDEEEWAEGNDEYSGDGSGSLGAGPNR